ncbi:MAG: hypothetical protein ACK4ZJ_07810, partial [Allorhizobium sp.]
MFIGSLQCCHAAMQQCFTVRHRSVTRATPATPAGSSFQHMLRRVFKSTIAGLEGRKPDGPFLEALSSLFGTHRATVSLEEIQAEIKDLRTQHGAEIKDLRTQHAAEINDLRTQHGAEINDLRTKISALRTRSDAQDAKISTLNVTVEGLSIYPSSAVVSSISAMLEFARSTVHYRMSA